MFGVNLKDFHLPTLPNELTNFVGNISDKAGSALNSVKKQSKKLTSKIIPNGESDKSGEKEKGTSEKPIDFLTLAGITEIDVEFGGVMELPGSYTTEYKRPCKDIIEYDTLVQQYIDQLRKDDAGNIKAYHKIGSLLNYNQSHNGIFVKRNAKIGCTPHHIPLKLQRRSKKIGEKCRKSKECIGKKTKCIKPLQGKYIAGTCEEPKFKGEGKVCKKTDDCPQGLVCDNGRCTKKLDREKNLRDAAARDKGKLKVELKELSGIRGETF